MTERLIKLPLAPDFNNGVSAFSSRPQKVFLPVNSNSSTDAGNGG